MSLSNEYALKFSSSLKEIGSKKGEPTSSVPFVVNNSVENEKKVSQEDKSRVFSNMAVRIEKVTIFSEKQVQDWINAAQVGDLKLIQQFLNQGFNINTACNVDAKLPDGSTLFVEGSTALHEAAANGHDELVKYLIQKNADIHKPPVSG